MGLSFRRTIPIGKSSRLNVSKRGVSVSSKKGRLTLNSRGRGTFRIAKGLSFRFGKN